MVRILILLALFALANAKLIRIPMIKKENHVISVENIRVERNYMMQKYHNTIEDDSQECVINMDKTIKSMFYAQVSVGTPPQLLNTVFDTSGHLAYVSGKQTCPTCTVYNATASSSALVIEQDLSVDIDYLNIQSFANNTLVQDIFNIGDIKPKLYFGINDFVYDDVAMLFGLGLPYIEFVNPPMFYMNQQQLLQNFEYSLYFDTNKGTDFGGHLILGGTDTTAYSGELTKVNYTDSSYAVTFTVDSFSINGVVAATKMFATIESAFNFIGVPLLTFIRINQQIDGIVDNEGNYFVNCDQVDNLPDVLFTIGGTVFTITPQSYILNVTQGLTPCMSAFTYLNSNMFNLGQPFLTNFYTNVNFKEKTLGFANLA